ncbi:hypothetical protein Tco_0467958 [Tanacetum coccineum]
MNIDSSSNSEGIVAIVNKLDSQGRDLKKLKENMHAIQVGCQTCGRAHLDKEYPLNEEDKSIEEVVYAGKEAPLNNAINVPHEVSFVQEEGVSSKVLPCQLPPKELNPVNFTLPCTIGSLNFYAMADLGARIKDDRVTFDMDKKIHNFTTPVGNLYMINSIHNDESPSCSNASSDKSSRGSIKGSGLSFLEFLLVKYREAKDKELIWDNRFSQQGIRIQGLLDSFSCGKKVLSGRNHLGYTGIRDCSGYKDQEFVSCDYNLKKRAMLKGVSCSNYTLVL